MGGTRPADADLVAAALAGSGRDAFAELVGRHWPAAVALAARVRSDGGDLLSRKHVMVLAERDGPGRLPIWIGPAEAYALAISLESAEAPRPLTYQLAARLLDAATARVSEVRITRLAGQIFYAVVVVDGPAAAGRWTPGPATRSTSPWSPGRRSWPTRRCWPRRPPAHSGRSSGTAPRSWRPRHSGG